MIHTYTYVCMYVCMHVFVYVRVYVCMYACIYVCMYLCMYACMHVCTYVYIRGEIILQYIDILQCIAIYCDNCYTLQCFAMPFILML